MKHGVGIIGLGAVGTTLARALARAGLRIRALIDQKNRIALALRDELHLDECAVDLNQLGGELSCLIISVPDDQLQQVDRSVARIAHRIQLSLCVHTAGALSGVVLEKIAACGIPVGSLHPLQTFTKNSGAVLLDGVYFAIEADPPGAAELGNLVKKLGGIPVLLEPGAKVYYHAAAVFASNFLPILLRSAVELTGAAGITEKQARKMLEPLMRKSLENCFQLGEASALTGPVVRGDLKTINLHLAALDRFNPHLADLYRKLSLSALELAQEKGLDDETAKAIYDLFERQSV
ncbi:MAG: DUF2520 domain-containing protein [bacterium]|nr:DUF2520 domain-containing protein [bacterium]